MHKKKKKIIIIVNKNDLSFQKKKYLSFHYSYITSVRYISIKQGTGVNIILNDIKNIFCNINQKNKHSPTKKNTIFRLKIGVIGQSNVGKSTFLNTLLKSKKHMSYNGFFTTADPIMTHFIYKKVKILFTDTAGIKINCGNLFNKIFINFSLNIIKISNIIFFITDIYKLNSTDDKKIINIIIKHFKPCLIIINKSDALNKYKKQEFVKKYVQYVFIKKYKFNYKLLSSINYKDVINIIPYIFMIYQTIRKKINIIILNNIIYNINLKKKHFIVNNQHIYIYFGKQITKTPISFIIFSNVNYVQINYYLYIQHLISKFLKFKNIPLKLIFKKVNI